MSMGIGDQGSANEDEIDRKLRELTEGLMAEPVLKEPSAAERAKRAGRDLKTTNAASASSGGMPGAFG